MTWASAISRSPQGRPWLCWARYTSALIPYPVAFERIMAVALRDVMGSRFQGKTKTKRTKETKRTKRKHGGKPGSAPPQITRHRQTRILRPVERVGWVMPGRVANFFAGPPAEAMTCPQRPNREFQKQPAIGKIARQIPTNVRS